MSDRAAADCRLPSRLIDMRKSSVVCVEDFCGLNRFTSPSARYFRASRPTKELASRDVVDTFFAGSESAEGFTGANCGIEQRERLLRPLYIACGSAIAS